MVVEPGREAAITVLILSVAADGDQQGLPGLGHGAQFLGEFVAVHHWQPDVQQNNVRGESLRDREGRGTIRRSLDLAPFQLEQQGQSLDHIGIIVDHQHASRGSLLGIGRLLGYSLFCRNIGQQGQTDGELGTLAQAFTLRLDAASVQTDQLFHQAEPDSQPAFGAVQGAICLGEKIENAGQHLRTDPETRVTHPDDGLSVFGRRRQPDLPVRLRVFGGIVEQIGYDLREPDQIAFDPNRLGR